MGLSNTRLRSRQVVRDHGQSDAPKGAADAGTRERVIAASLALFNRDRERHVTTNHIAAHLGISPGNLYYYFRNKEEIIFEIYLRLEKEFLACLALPRGRPLSLDDIATYLHGIFEILWRYRFFFHELPSLVERIPAVRERYADLVDKVLACARSIYQGLAHEGIMEATPEQVDMLAKNSWIVTVYWFTFLETRGGHETVTREDSRRGILQLVALFYPYLRAPAKRFVDGAIGPALESASPP